MAPLPSNNTGVLFVDYNTCGEDHTIQCRFNAAASFNDSMALMDGFLTAISASTQLITITGARVRDVGSNVTYPVTWTGAATYGSGAGTHDQAAWFFDFVGRSIGGRRVRMAVFGAQTIVDGSGHDYRLDTGTASIAAAIAALESDGNACCAIDGDAPSWHQYANSGVNAYWRNHIRA